MPLLFYPVVSTSYWCNLAHLQLKWPASSLKTGSTDAATQHLGEALLLALSSPGSSQQPGADLNQ